MALDDWHEFLSIKKEYLATHQQAQPSKCPICKEEVKPEDKIVFSGDGTSQHRKCTHGIIIEKAEVIDEKWFEKQITEAQPPEWSEEDVENLNTVYALLTKRWEQMLKDNPNLAKKILYEDAVAQAKSNHFHDSKEEIENTVKFVLKGQLSDTFPNSGCWHERSTWNSRYDEHIRFWEAIKRLEALLSQLSRRNGKVKESKEVD
jgi:hypothetical protein